VVHATGVDPRVVNWMIIKIHGTGSTTDNITAKELLIIQASAEEQEVALIFLYSADKAKNKLTFLVLSL